MAKNNDKLLKELKDAVHEYKKAKGRATDYNHSRTIRSAELGERLSKVKEQMDAGDFTGLGDITTYNDLYAVLNIKRRWAEKLVERHRNPGKKDAPSVRIITLKEGSVIKIGTTLFKVLGAPENEDEVVRTKVKGQYRVSLLLATPDNPRAVAHAKRALQQAANLAEEVPPKKLRKAKTIKLCKEDKERRRKAEARPQPLVLHYGESSNPFTNASDCPEDQTDTVCGLMYDGGNVTTTSDMAKINCPDCLKALQQVVDDAKQRLDVAIEAYRTSPDDKDIEFRFWKAQKAYKYFAEGLLNLCPERVQ